MDVALFIFCAISLTMSSACAALLFAYRHQRQSDLNAREQVKSELLASLKKFTDEHNKLVSQLADTHDRMGALDMKISGVAGKPQAARKF